MTTGISMVVAVGPQPPADVEAVDIGQHQVQEHHVGDALPGQSQAGLAVLGDDRLVVAQCGGSGQPGPPVPGWSSTIRAVPIVPFPAVSRPGFDHVAIRDCRHRRTLLDAVPSSRLKIGATIAHDDMQLDDVAVVQLVVAFHGLAVENTGAPDPSGLQRLLEIPMNFPGQIQDGTADGKREWFGPIGRFARDFRVDPQHPQ